MTEQLSHAQRTIIELDHKLGHMLVLAVPGSGKTRVIAERVAYLLDQQIAPPEQVVVMTFTEKAAAHLSKRLEDRLGGAVQGIRVGTIHSICNHLLEQHGLAIGLKPQFKTYDVKWQEEALRAAA